MRKLVAGLLAVFLVLSPAVVRAESGTSGTVQVTVRAIREDGSPLSGRVEVFNPAKGSWIPVYDFRGEGSVSLEVGRYHFVVVGLDAQGNEMYYLVKTNVEVAGTAQTLEFDARKMTTGRVRVSQKGFDSARVMFWGEGWLAVPSLEDRKTAEFVVSTGTFCFAFEGIKRTNSGSWSYRFSAGEQTVRPGQTLDLGTFGGTLTIDLSGLQERYKLNSVIAVQDFVKDAAGHALGSIDVNENGAYAFLQPQVKITGARGVVYSASTSVLWVPVDWEPGIYVLEVNADTGPLQGTITATKTFEVVPPEGTAAVKLRAVWKDGSLMSGRVYVEDARTSQPAQDVWNFGGEGFLALKEGKYHFVLAGPYSEDSYSDKYLLVRRDVELTATTTEIVFDAKEMPTGTVAASQRKFDYASITLQADGVNMQSCLNLKTQSDAEFVVSTGTYSFEFNGQKAADNGSWWYYTFSAGKLRVGVDQTLDLGFFGGPISMDLSGVEHSYNRGGRIRLEGFVKDGYRHMLTSIRVDERGSWSFPTPNVRVVSAAGSEVYKASGWSYAIPVTWPAGKYTLEVSLNTGPYQGIVTATKQFEVAVFEKTETLIVLQIGKSVFTVDGMARTLDSPPIIKNGRTLLPIRAIVEALGGQVGWDANQKKVTVTLGSNRVELWIGKNTALVNGRQVMIDATNPKVVPEIINGRTMLPLRFVAESLGCSVEWDGNTQTVRVTYQKP